jgi:hypothetical protein
MADWSGFPGLAAARTLFPQPGLKQMLVSIAFS